MAALACLLTGLLEVAGHPSPEHMLHLERCCWRATPAPCPVPDLSACVLRREDLRHLPVCSVDPPGCKDIDDALHIRPLPGGALELGVHIADVTHFLAPGTAMDAEAASRRARAPARPARSPGIVVKGP